jgi:hypothetical protein
MSNDTVVNGRVPRKSLASQLDRLDGILDGLSEALQGAVADAVKEAVGPMLREAVREAVVATVQAVLSNPELQTLSAAAPNVGSVAPPAPKVVAGPGTRLSTTAKTMAQFAGRKARALMERIVDTARVTLRLRRPLGFAVAVGAAVGLACYLTGPQVAATVSAFTGFAASLTASGLRAVRRALPGS